MIKKYQSVNENKMSADRQRRLWRAIDGLYNTISDALPEYCFNGDNDDSGIHEINTLNTDEQEDVPDSLVALHDAVDKFSRTLQHFYSASHSARYVISEYYDQFRFTLGICASV